MIFHRGVVRGELRALFDSERATVDEAALLIARDNYPSLSLDAYRARLDALADRAVLGLSRSSTLDEQLASLRDALFTSGGLEGNRENYYDARNSYLNDVLDRKLGIPISLATVALGVGRRAGIVLQGVGFPGHFLLRIGGPSGPLVDPFDGLRVMERSQLEEILARVFGAATAPELDHSHTEPVTTRVIIVRTLSNLHKVHSAQKDHARAFQVCDRLVELEAGAHALRDRGLHALALGSIATAREDLEAYLGRGKVSDREQIEALLRRPGASTIAWN